MEMRADSCAHGRANAAYTVSCCGGSCWGFVPGPVRWERARAAGPDPDLRLLLELLLFWLWGRLDRSCAGVLYRQQVFRPLSAQAFGRSRLSVRGARIFLVFCRACGLSYVPR